MLELNLGTAEQVVQVVALRHTAARCGHGGKHVAVEYEDLVGVGGERAGGGQAAEAGADDDHAAEHHLAACSEPAAHRSTRALHIGIRSVPVAVMLPSTKTRATAASGSTVVVGAGTRSISRYPA